MHLRFRRHWAIVLLLAICLPPAVRSAWAECLSSTLEEQIHAAKLIFAGTVKRMHSYRTSLSINTDYEFDNVRYAKGSGPKMGLVLTQQGGRVDSILIDVEDEVGFEVGHRYVVFAGDWRGYLSAIPCASWHPFGIRSDSGYAIPVAHAGGTSIALFDEHHIVLVLGDRWQPRHGFVKYDVGGHLIPQSPPPRRTLGEELHDADARLSTAPQDWIPGIGWSRALIRRIVLWPHQDPGTRVTEDALLQRLAAIVALQSTLEADSSRSK